MVNRWAVLALLFAVRTVMAIQYQSIAAVAPVLMEDYRLSIADVGLLIGLYLAPGLLLALPGGAIGRRFGDKRSVVAGLVLMTVGGAIMVLAESWSGQVIGRLISGVGGVLLNVLMSKMIVDWFAGREMATAMAIFINSWPVGIALALLALPILVMQQGVAATFLVCTALVLAGLVALMLLYREPPRSAATGAATVPSRPAAMAVIAAGTTWSLFNACAAMVFGFGPALLVEHGWSIAAAGSTVSLTLWFMAASVPLGGYATDRLRQPIVVIVAGCIGFAVLMFAATQFPSVLMFAALGVVGGLPAGAIMSLPARVLSPSALPIGMGLYFTIFYAGMLAGPLLGGSIGSWAGSAAATFHFGALLALGACMAVLLFRRLAAAASNTAIHTALPRQPAQ